MRGERRGTTSRINRLLGAVLVAILGSTSGCGSDEGTESARATGQAVQATFVSDDFSPETTLGAHWTLIDPDEIAGVEATGTNLKIALPPGDGDYERWLMPGARVLQGVDDGDFDVIAKFESVPRYHNHAQGIVVQLTQDTFLRFGVHSSWGTPRVYVLYVEEGWEEESLGTDVELPLDTVFLRVTRTGDTFAYSYSTDGVWFEPAHTIELSIEAEALGIYATNAGWEPFTASVDAFFDATGPFEDTDGPPLVHRAPYFTNVPFRLARVGELYSEVVRATDPDRGPVAFSMAATPSWLTLVDHEDGTATLSGTPSASDLGAHPVRVVATDAAGRPTEQAFELVVQSEPISTSLVSDDFGSPSLSPYWTLVDPTGNATVTTTGTNAILRVPGGMGHDLWIWEEKRAPRLLQRFNGGDFSVEVKLESPTTEWEQFQGIIAQTDHEHFLRFDVRFEYPMAARAATVLGSSGIERGYVSLPGSSESYLRVTRVGNQWTYEVSPDGSSFTSVASFTDDIVINHIGIFAGNGGWNLPFAASIDYFNDLSDPITDDDEPAQGNTAPYFTSSPPLRAVVGQTYEYEITVGDDEGGPLGLEVLYWTPDWLALEDFGDGTGRLWGVPGPEHIGVHSVYLGVHDGIETSTQQFSLLVAGTEQSTAILSDDFSPETSLASHWRLIDPVGDVTFTATGTNLEISVPGGTSHRLWEGVIDAPRVVQAAPDEDFAIEAKFESVPSGATSFQGIVVQENDDEILRFESYSQYGLQNVVAMRVGLTEIEWFATRTVAAAPERIKVERAGDGFMYSYALPGEGYQVAAVFTHPMTVTAVGVYAGNDEGNPAFVSSIDYFSNLASPVTDTDQAGAGAPLISFWHGPTLAVGAAGRPQQAVNVLGRIEDPDGIASASFAVDGGAPRTLVYGPDGYRLEGSGDFNIVLTGLAPGFHTIRVTAEDANENVADVTLGLNLIAGAAPTFPWIVDWSNASALSDYAQVVDGQWSVSATGARTAETGYRRAIALGDASWESSYEVTVPVTVHAAPSSDFGVGILLGWQGHDGAGDPPAEWPTQALTWIGGSLSAPELRLVTYPEAVLEAAPLEGLELEATYVLKTRTEDAGAGLSRVSSKVWLASESEPAEWQVQEDVPRRSGSILLVAHRADVTFGNVSVAPAGTGCALYDFTCDGVDDDCDGVVDDDFQPTATTCGVGACGATGVTSCVNGVVVDSCAPKEPASSDATCDGVDDDCDGLVDEDYVPEVETCGVGACQATGETACVGGSVVSGCVPGDPSPNDATCNGIDDDCDGQVDEDYVPQATTCGVGACGATGQTQCVAGVVTDTCQPGTPAANDATCNGIDDDCDGQIDEDYVAVATSCGTGACAATGTTSCVAGNVVDSCSPGAPAANDASCNGIDDDCDGQIDEDYVPVATTCGIGACGATGSTACVGGVVQDSCTPLEGDTEDATCDGVDDDCDGSIDEDYLPQATSCGEGACAATGATACIDGVEVDSCEPGNPAADDATCDGIDNDCDGEIDEDYVSRAISCGVGACAATGQTSCVAGVEASDCQPGTPAANDATCNGVDDDCDGSVDEDFVSSATTCGVGACAGSGQTTCIGGVLGDTCAPGTPAADDATCNGIDDDCDGQVDEDYEGIATTCGVGACGSSGATVCLNGAVVDSCTPGTPAAHDATCNGIDDDCDGSVDEDFVPTPTSCGVGACAASGVTSCQGGVLVDSCTPGTPAANDATCNGIDDDCDGALDEDYMPVATSCGVGACAAVGVTSCVLGVVEDSCRPGDPALIDSICNGIDDDCDGAVDEEYVSQVTSCGVGACASTGSTSCVHGVEVDSCQAGTPAANDATCDGVDDDCDGQVDEDFVSTATSCGVGACQASGVTSCVGGTIADSCQPGTPAANDVTCDGIDDDCDGLVDEDYQPSSTVCGDGSCTALGSLQCIDGSEVDSCVPGSSAASDATCDGIDNDCDGLIDEDYTPRVTTCGVGACAATGITSCVGGVEYDSCTPGVPAANDATCDGVDDDCDGLVDEDYGPVATSCGVGACGAAGVTSCVDGVVYDSCQAGTPAEDDATCDGIDDDCDGIADEDYAPQIVACGVGACAASGVTACLAGTVVDDCEPGEPAGSDATCDGIDDDCDGFVDEDYVSQSTSCGGGACAASGTTSCVGGAVVDSCQPGAPAAADATCDGIDDDCDGVADEDYAPVQTSCGVGACAASGTTSCVDGSVVDDCSPLEPAANDATCDGVDDDCDGSVDEDYVPVATDCGVGACAATGITSCVDGSVADSCTPKSPIAANDATCDGIDDDCDGSVDEDYVPVATSCGVGVCAATGATSCVSGSVVDSCTPGEPVSATDATCDGVDDDCDGLVDEDYVPVATSCGVGVCAATGATSCVSGSVVDSCTPGEPVSATDATCDGVDDNCNGVADEGYVSTSTSCGIGACARTGATSCVSGSVVDSCEPGFPGMSDATCDGVDDDCDGTVDEDYVPVTTSCGVGACARTGTSSCVDGAVQENCVAGTPASDDATCNGVDDDCDGSVDEDFQPSCSGDSVQTCVNGALQVASCSDGNVCNGVESCSGASCVSGSPLETDDQNPCTADACDPVSGVTHSPVALGVSCGASRVCDGQGSCIGPPVIVTQPVDVSVTAGQPYSLSVVATGALLTYQWQRAGVDIPGATSPVYSVSAADPGDSGLSFRVVVSNPAGSVTSTAVTLTVGDTAGPLLSLDKDYFETSADSIEVTGAAVDAGSGVETVFVRNDRYPGTELVAIVTPGTGVFAVEVPLAPGLNTLTVVARDVEGNETEAIVTATSNLLSVPTIRLTAPLPGSVVTTETIDVQGTVRSSLLPEQIRLFLGTNLVFPSGSGGEYPFTFSGVALEPGVNSLSLRVETPETIVTQSFAVTYDDGSGSSIGGPPPAIELPGVSPIVYVTSGSHQVSGRVTAATCVESITVNGVEVVPTGMGNSVTFDSPPISIPGDGLPFEITVTATDCNGVSSTVGYAVVYDETPPMLSLSVEESPFVNTTDSTPFTIFGTVTEPNLAGLTTNHQSIGVLPAGEGVWDFSVQVPLVAGQQQSVTFTVWDRSGNRVDRTVLLLLDSSLEIDLIAPTANEKITRLEDPVNVPVVARAPGMAATDIVMASVDGQASVILAKSGDTATGTVQVPLQTGTHQLVVRVTDATSLLKAQVSRSFSIVDARSVEPEVVDIEPPRGATNVEANQFVHVRFNRPIDTAKLAVSVTETVQGKEYASAPPGSDVMSMNELTLVEVRRHAEAVPGGIAAVPGNDFFTFYPQRDYGYGGTVTVTVVYDGEELHRSTFRVRPAPTLIEGFVADQFFQPVPGLRVALAEAGQQTVSDQEGAFRFGFGTFANSIPGGRHRLVLNEGMADRRYGTIEVFINAQTGRLSDVGVVRVPLLNPAVPFRLLSSRTAEVVLGNDFLKLDLSGADLVFANGQSSGLVHAQPMVGPRVGYPVHRTAVPVLTYALQPGGIQVSGPISVELALPALGGSDKYIDALPDRVVLIGLDPGTLQLLPVGVGVVDREGRRVTSAGVLAPRRLDFLGFGLAPATASAALDAYVAGQIGLDDLIGRLQYNP